MFWVYMTDVIQPKFWYWNKAHIFLISSTKCQYKVTLRLGDMSKKVVNYLKTLLRS